MNILVIILINLAVVVGGGELTDKGIELAKKTDSKLDTIVKKVGEKPVIKVNVNPIINFKPVINVKPVIKINNVNNNKSDTEVK